MKYIANPVEVDAFRIIEVFHPVDLGRGVFQTLRLEDGRRVQADRGMIARMDPEVGDYYVIQSDGYVYLNPKDVFERKYHPAENTVDSKGNFHGSPEAEKILGSVKSLRRN